MTSMWRTCGWVLLGSALILALSLGVRHGFGLFLAPMSSEFGWGRGVFAFAIALQNLMWGLAQPFAGAGQRQQYRTLGLGAVQRRLIEQGDLRAGRRLRHCPIGQQQRGNGLVFLKNSPLHPLVEVGK